jgi:antirestriction protein
MKTLKEKYNSIDQSKISAEQKSFLSKIKNVTKDFSIKDKEVNDKVEGALDKMIATFKDKMPEAIKETTSATPKKRNAMSVAKEIRKDGETFTEAKKRAIKKISDDKESAKETIKSELDKLNDFIKSRKKLADIKGTDLLRDSKRKAKPVGKRISKSGRVYYEYRDSKTDRLSPSYPKNAPYLAGGGGVDGIEVIKLKVYSTSGNIIREGDFLINYNDSTITFPSGKTFKVVEDREYTFKIQKTQIKANRGIRGLAEFLKDINKPDTPFKSFAMTLIDLDKDGKYELGGSVVTDLAGHTGGSLGVGNKGMLDGFSNTSYSGLVGETGAMSSGELFMAGGSVGMVNQQVIDDASQSYVNYYLGEGASAGIYKDGGSIENQYAGKSPEQIWNMLSISQRYHFLHDHKKEIESTPASVEKATKTAYKFLPEKIKISFKKHIEMGQYAGGGSVKNERKHVNKAEDYEVRYSKPRPSRKGYLGKRDFSRGGLTGESARVDILKEEFASEDLIDELKEKLNLKSDDLKNQDVIAFAYTNYGGTTIDKYAIEYFLENYPRNIVVEETSYNGKNAFVFGKPAKEWMEQSDDYILGFNDFESFYYEKENEDFMEGINFFITDLQRYYIFNIEEVRDSLEEKFYGYFNVDTSGLDYSHEQMEDYLKEEGLLKEPKEEFAKGGGVRKVGNREYSYGRNWTNDFRHINKAEEHEVNYTRKGKFLGIFADGGGVDKWIGYDKDHLMNMKNGMIVLRGTDLKDIKPKDIKGFDMLDNRGYSKGGSVTNERKHVNHSEDYEVRYAKPRLGRKGYKGARKFMAGGMNEDTPKVYVADLEAYNNGKLIGEWLDLSDYNDADELMDAIQDFLKTSGGGEYAIHDYENLPSSMYSEYMGKRDFEEIYQMIDLAKENNLPLEVVMEVVNDYGESALDEYNGVYDSAVDFAEELADDIGIQSFIDFRYYTDISETDRRLLAQEMADNYVDDIRSEDEGRRLIEEGELDLDEFEEADYDRKEEMLDEARENVYNEYYDNWYEGLDDPYTFLVEEQGLYDDESFVKANFVQVDYEKLADALEQDYTFIRHDGQVYVFNIR